MNTKDKPFRVIAAVTAVMFLQSWIADGIEGSPLFNWACGGLALTDQPWSTAALLLVMLSVVVLLTWWIYLNRRTFLPIQIQRIGEPDAVDPHAILAMTVSYPGAWQIDFEGKQITSKEKQLSLDASLDEVLNRLASLGDSERFAWEQLLRALRKHVAGGKLRQVYLIGSPGERGTAAKFTECRDFLRLFYPSIAQESFHGKEADFENIEELRSVYRDIIAQAGQDKSQIMIDVTGGTKVVSIAAAMVTMEHPEIEFQYIETKGSKRVRSFNVIGGGYENGQ